MRARVNIKMLVSLIIIAVIWAAPLHGLYADETGAPGTSDPEAIPENMALMAENQFLRLYMDKTSTSVGIQDKRSGKVWFTNPPEGGEDEGWQLSLKCVDTRGQISEMNNYKDAIKKEQFEIIPINNGVKVVYTLGKIERGLEELPQKISGERFQKLLLDKVSEEDQRELKRRYLYNESQDLWIIRPSLSAMMISKLIEIIDKAGYTREDLIKDNTDNGVPMLTTERIIYKIPLEYRLEEDHLVVSIPVEEIEYPEEHPIHKLGVLEFFGAEKNNREGYIFIPDGSGALVNFGPEDNSRGTYYASIYGDDGAMDAYEKKLIGEQVTMPVFGIKQADKALFAIVEDGDALGNIRCEKVNNTQNYNKVFAEFDIVKYDFIRIGGSYETQVAKFQEKMYDGDIRIRYAFLHGEEADYVGMAHYYQEYLVKKHNLEKLQAKQDIPFFLETLGAIYKNKSFLGIFNYRGLVSLTSYRENIEILEMLKERGISNISLRLLGWFNSGMEHTIPSRLRLESVLGGKRGLKSLIEYAQEQQVSLYPDVNFLTFANKKNGFWGFRDAAKTIDEREAVIFKFHLATRMPDWWKSNSGSAVLSPRRIPDIINKFIGKYLKLGIDALCANDLAKYVNADYRKNATIDRQNASILISGQAKTLKDEIGSLMVQVGNVNVAVYADKILNVADEYSRFYIEDERVPFYQIVFHGYKEYAGAPINLSENRREALLKAVETGAGIYFTWIYEDASILKNTDFDHYLSVHYGDWLDIATEYYQKANAVLKDVQNQRITDHKKLQDNVYMTVYENGNHVIVNYNDHDVEISQRRISAQDFILLEGGN